MNIHRSRRHAAAVAVTAVLLLAGCGSDGDRGAEGTSSNASADASPAPGEDPEGTTAPLATDTPGIAAGSGTARVVPQEDVFSVLSPWNNTISDARVDPRSEAMIEQSKIRTAIGLDGQEEQTIVEDGVYVNTREWTVPVVADGVATTVTCRQIQCGDGGDDLVLDIPEDVDPDPLYDGWFTVFDPAAQIGYDLWRARREDDGTISYHFMRQWDLDGPGFNQPYVVSARGSGLPLFAGLIRPGELERGQINHALAISVPGPAADYFIQPASSTDGNNNSRMSLPEGARIRLRDDFQLARPVDPVTGAPLHYDADRQKYAGYIVEALQEYGAIVVDRAAVPTLYFERLQLEAGRTPLLAGYELQSLLLDDFEVMDFTDQRRFAYPPDDQVVDPTGLEFAGGSVEGEDGQSTPDTVDESTEEEQ